MTTLALSMIVRDASKFLPQCLASVTGAVDEIVIADTGSRDDTIAVARRFGARILQIPWNNNFAEARNCALAESRSDWILVLDADEQLDPGAKRNLPALLRNPMVAGYLVTIRNYVLSLDDRIWDRAARPNDNRLPSAASFPAYVEHENVRLFRRDPRIRFVGRVHETVGPCIVSSGRKLGEANFCIHHFGLALDVETRARKNTFYRELGRQKIREMPRNAQAHLELGLVEMDNFDNLDEALALFQTACHLDPKLGVARFFEGLTLVKLSRFAPALPALEEAERLGHSTALVAETRGDAHYNLGQFPLAGESYEIALQRDPINAALESKLGLSIVRSGDTVRGIEKMRRAIVARPSVPELHDRLIVALVWLNHLEDAAAAAEHKLSSIGTPQPGDFLRAASLWAKIRKWPQSSTALKSGLRLYPGNDSLRRALEEAVHVASAFQIASILQSSRSGG